MSKTSDRSAIDDGKAQPRDATAGMPHQASPLEIDILQKAILNSAEFAIIATDARGTIQLSNNDAERMLGSAASDVVNKKTPDDLHDPQQLIARAGP